MDSEPYYSKLYGLQEKLKQALSIKKRLDDKKESIILILHNLDDADKILGSLQSLQKIYGREEQVLAICEQGLGKARETLHEVEGLVDNSGGFTSRVQSWFSFGKKDNTLLMGHLLRLVFSELRRQINYILDNYEYLKELVHLQNRRTLGLISKVQKGYFVGNISQTHYFHDILRFRHDELQFMRRIEKCPSAGKIEEYWQQMRQLSARIYELSEKNPVTRKLLQVVQKYPKLSAIQGAIFPLPTVTTVAATGAVYFQNPLYFLVFYPVGALIEFSPCWIALILELRSSK